MTEAPGEACPRAPRPLPRVSPAGTRRDVVRLVAVGAGAGVLAACSPGRPAEPGPLPVVPSDAVTASPTAAPDDDTALVATVLTEIRAAAAFTVAAQVAAGRLRPVLGPLDELHAAHAAALAASVTGSSEDGSDGGTDQGGDGDAADLAGRSAAGVLRAVRRREETTRRRLAGWSLDARSGALARLLASMAAGLAQHLAALPARPPARRGREGS